jgi:hypothetical protein
VYGRWGEGKSTLLDLIATLAASDDLPVARFTPSSVADATQLWNLFFLGSPMRLAEQPRLEKELKAWLREFKGCERRWERARD